MIPGVYFFYLNVGLLAGLRKKSQVDLAEIFSEGWTWPVMTVVLVRGEAFSSVAFSSFVY